MQKTIIYIAEPDTIDVKIVEKALGDAPHALIMGSNDFTVGDAAACDTLIVRSVARVEPSIRQKMPLLTRVVRIGTGLDTINLDFCAKAGIAVYNAAGANAQAVADYAVTVIMMALRKLHLLTPSDVQSWNRFKFTGQDISTRTVGIVGFGHIGKSLYQKLSSLGCRDFLLYDPFVTTAPEYARFVTTEELLKNSHVISLHLPLLPQTTHFIDAKNIALLKKDAILLNAARGGIVDESAVVEALKTNHFTYITDTVEGEPHVNPVLLNNENIVITPHMASLTSGAEEAMVMVAIDNLFANKQAVVLPPK